MKCAQCEKAEATLRCVDEDLDFCDRCSVLLHKKKARLHHEVVPRKASLVCDECEDTAAEVECFQCGGGRTALVFCLTCSDSLHSRVARASHLVAFINMPKVPGMEKSVEGRAVIELSDLDSDEDNLNIFQKDTNSGSRLALKSFVKQEARAVNSKSKVRGISTNDRDTLDIRLKKSPKPNGKIKNLLSPEAEGGQSTIASLVKLDDDKNGKENDPGNGRRRTLANKLLVKKEQHRSEGESNSSDSDRDESDDELNGVRRIKKGSVSLEAFVVDMDDEDDDPSGVVPDNKIEPGIRTRIRNMLELGLHPNTPEFEAQQALKNAQRLLTKHNLQQAEVLKGTLADTSSLVGGMRVVELRAKGKVKQGRMDTWVRELGWVIADNFDCQYFFKAGTSSNPFRVVFYGISQNADCAGYAFAGTYNRISTMAAAYIACNPLNDDPDDDKENQAWKQHEQVNRGTYTRVARTNYRKGLVAGLKEAVKNAQRIRKEDVLSDAKMKMPSAEQSSTTNKSASCEIEGEGSCFFSSGQEFTQNGDYSDDDTNTITQMAERCMAITALVLHSQKVGDEYLKQQGIKVRKRTIKSRVAVWNEEAFKQGKTDAATIDINQKSITGAKVKKSRGSAK